MYQFVIVLLLKYTFCKLLMEEPLSLISQLQVHTLRIQFCVSDPYT